MSFQQRMAIGVPFEREVRAALTINGWLAEPFGQCQLSDAMREMLRAVQPATPVRWMPDIVASRRFAARTLVVYVDAKGGERWRETGRHAFETCAVGSAGKWADYSTSPTYFVCSDWTVYTPAIVAEQGEEGAFRGSGSGTPFLLVSRVFGYAFDDIFSPLRMAP